MGGGPFGPECVPAVPSAGGLTRTEGTPLTQTSQDAMSGETIRHTVRVTNPEGMHMRPATAFAELARLFQSSVTVHKGTTRVNGKSPLDMMLLAAEEGSELILEVNGPDAQTALQGLVELLVALAVITDSQLPLPPKG
jgi:phosphocarrier protein HPr